MFSRRLASASALGLALAAACGPGGGGGGPEDDVDAAIGPDAGGGIDAPDLPKNAAVYAHTSSMLYRVDPETNALSPVGPFTGAAAGDQMTDIAIDSLGEMIGISFTRVYRIDSATADTTRIGTATLPQMFNGLSYVPSQLALGTPGPDVLVGLRNTDGRVFRLDPLTGGVTEIGNMGGVYRSSGDIVAVTGFGIVATVTGATATDLLVRLEPGTFAATPIGTGTGFSGLWGVGYWRDTIFGFGSGGAFVRIDTSTGAGTLIENNGVPWWGAAVTTAAPIIP